MSCCRNAAQPLLRRLGARGIAPVARAMSTAAPTSSTSAAPRARSGIPVSKFEAKRTAAAAPGGAQPRQSLPELLTMLASLKAEGRTPTRAAYIALIRAAADYGSRRGNNLDKEAEGESSNTLGLEIALGAVRDAAAGGIELGSEATDELLRLTFVQPEILPSVLLEITAAGRPTTATFNTMAAHAVAGERFEETLVLFAEMLQQGLVPSRTVTKQLIGMACKWGLPRLALNIAERFEQLPGSTRIDSSAWVQILASSADCQFLEGVDKAWGRTVSNKAYTPDEGLILQILAVAARWGRTRLAHDALACLPAIGVEAQEHHMAPLVEALCREGRVPDALKLVSQIRSAGIEPAMSTVNPIVRILNTTELLDQAFYALEDQHKAGTAVDVVAFNAVIAAAAKLGDLQRARATQLAAADLGVIPNAETFNFVLSACRAGRHAQLGETIMSEMADANIAPTMKIYENMVHLCLTQVDYEHAFYFLESMKSAGFKPRSQIYMALGRKLARHNDERYKLVAEEMETLGYTGVDFLAESKKAPEDRARTFTGKNQNKKNSSTTTNNSNNNRRHGGNRPRRNQEKNQEQNSS